MAYSGTLKLMLHFQSSSTQSTQSSKNILPVLRLQEIPVGPRLKPWRSWQLWRPLPTPHSALQPQIPLQSFQHLARVKCLKIWHCWRRLLLFYQSSHPTWNPYQDSSCGSSSRCHRSSCRRWCPLQHHINVQYLPLMGGAESCSSTYYLARW